MLHEVSTGSAMDTGKEWRQAPMVSPDQVLDLHARIQLEGPQDRTGLPQQLLKARCDRFDGVLQAVLARLGYPDLCRHVRNVLKADSEGTRQLIYKWVQIARAKSLRSERAGGEAEDRINQG